MFYFVVDLNGIDTESFQYDTLDEAIAGAHRLALSSLKAWEDDGIERCEHGYCAGSCSRCCDEDDGAAAEARRESAVQP